MTYHGTSGGYTNHACRCDDCRTAQAQYMREYRAGDPERQAKNREARMRRYWIVQATPEGREKHRQQTALWRRKGAAQS